MDTPPQQTENHRRYIPPEIIEEVLLNLPVKSLLRFSSVSKPWNSMIFEDGFIKGYRRRAALPGRERVFFLDDSVDLPLSDLLSDNPIEDDATVVVDPLLGSDIVASCDKLWCFGNREKNSLCIWNPSMRTYRELPPPQLSTGIIGLYYQYYGLGYDSMSDDYKLVKINNDRQNVAIMDAEMYSLRSDSWKKIQPFPLTTTGGLILISYMGWFVSGALHWLPRANGFTGNIISFNISTETYGELMLPNEIWCSNFPQLELDVVRGKLCLMETMMSKRLSLWVMEDYGVVESWNKKFDIAWNTINPMLNKTLCFPWRPLYFCDNGQIVIRCFHHGNTDISGIYVSENDKTLGWKKLSHSFCGGTYVYVESLVSPVTWPTPVALANC